MNIYFGVFPIPRILSVLYILSFAGLFLSFIGMTAWGAEKDLSAWLLFYMPILWIFWIVCVFLLQSSVARFRLWVAWWIINLTILSLFISFAMRVENWGHSSGMEFGVLLVYFPIVMPTLLFFIIAPHDLLANLSDFLIALFGGGSGDAFAIWVFFSGIAFLQSLALIWFSGRIKSGRR